MKATRNMSYRGQWDSVIQIYGELCAYCHNQPATCIDHVVPVSYKENHRIENLRPSCSWCNLLASDRVFETFEAKYEWLREYRLSKKVLRNRRTICKECWLPYQCPLHSPNLFLCAECWDWEYEGEQLSTKRQWREWLSLLIKAGFNLPAHAEFRVYMQENNHGNLSPRDKRRIFSLIQSSKENEDGDEE